MEELWIPEFVGEYTRKLILDHRAQIEEQTIETRRDSNGISKRIKVTVKNVHGKDLYESTAAIVQRAYEKIEDRVKRDTEYKISQSRPYEALKNEIKQITAMEFNNNTSAGNYSSRQTFNGFDICMDSKFEITIKVHNAANPILWFGALQETRIISMNTYNIDTFRHRKNEFSYFKVIDAIHGYLAIDPDIRRKELGMKNEENK